MSAAGDAVQLAEELAAAEAVVVGAGAGLSTAAGLAYSGERFERYFGDSARRHGFCDMYSGGFFPYETPGERWAFWSRYVWINRYAPIPGSAYDDLRDLIAGKDAFVITTNVDHCFQRAGFAKERLFYTQGDYGLLQCSGPCRQETWDNRGVMRAMVEAQGFAIAPDGGLLPPRDGAPGMTVPDELVPRCPRCGRPAAMNLRADGTFAEDAGWHEAAGRYGDFLRSRLGDGRRVLFLELGVGLNTPVIIKYPFWQMTERSPRARYACVNLRGASAPRAIEDRSTCVEGDIAAVLRELRALKEA